MWRLTKMDFKRKYRLRICYFDVKKIVKIFLMKKDILFLILTDYVYKIVNCEIDGRFNPRRQGDRVKSPGFEITFF